MTNVHNSVAFVGSTLPARAVFEKVTSNEIDTVIASTSSLARSFIHLSSINPKLKIKSLPSNPIFQFFVVFQLLLRFKLSRRKIWIYHEACWPVLDLAIWITRPRGFFTPQANMTSFSRLSRADSLKVLKGKRFGSLLARPMSYIFDIYAQINDGGKEMLYLPVIRGYPKSMTYHEDSSLVQSYEFLSDVIKTEVGEKSILFTVGTDAVESYVLTDLFMALIKEAKAQNYEIFIKDHPNELVRLNMNVNNATILDPTMPAELMPGGYRYIVGCGTAALASFGGRAISILELLDTMEVETRQKRISYLSSLNRNVIYINSIENFAQCLRNDDSLVEKG